LIKQAIPLIKWAGGKRKLAKYILPLFPEHKTYIEPFCGGAALFFARQNPCKFEVINDINGDLINLYRVVQNHKDEFLKQFEWLPASRELFEQWQARPIEHLTDIQRAARFYYLQNLTFGGKVCKTRCFAANTTDYHGLRVERLKALLPAAHQRLAKTTIERLPWKECIERYDRPYSFFYLDPPYWRLTGYGVPFKWPEYEALADCMRHIKGKALLSINDHSDIRALFADFEMQTVRTIYRNGGSNSKAANELIITNYPANQSVGLLQ